MGCYKVMLEGRCFLAKTEKEEEIVGFFATIGISATTRQEFFEKIESGLNGVIEANSLNVLRESLKKSFCKISAVYVVEGTNDFAGLGGITLFSESALQPILANFIRIYLSVVKPHELVNIKRD
ncbi:MAG TPA: hypothetical protein VEC06_20050 [Paucimonas sp.]|nr:hypothetical protein [Paucimonas sp.]